MPIVPNQEKGAVLTGVFDRGDMAKLKSELETFQAQLATLQRNLGFEAFVPIVTEEGGKITITVIPCAASAPGAQRADAIGKLGDSFAGSGKAVDPDEARKSVAGYEAKSSGSFLEDPDFAG